MQNRSKRAPLPQGKIADFINHQVTLIKKNPDTEQDPWGCNANFITKLENILRPMKCSACEQIRAEQTSRNCPFK